MTNKEVQACRVNLTYQKALEDLGIIIWSLSPSADRAGNRPQPHP